MVRSRGDRIALDHRRHLAVVRSQPKSCMKQAVKESNPPGLLSPSSASPPKSLCPPAYAPPLRVRVCPRGRPRAHRRHISCSVTLPTRIHRLHGWRGRAVEDPCTTSKHDRVRTQRALFGIDITARPSHFLVTVVWFVCRAFVQEFTACFCVGTFRVLDSYCLFLSASIAPKVLLSAFCIKAIFNLTGCRCIRSMSMQ